MKEEMKKNLDLKQERDSEKIRQKKNNFTMAYILVGIAIIAILIIFLVAFLLNR